MSQWQPVDKQKHQHAQWSAGTDYRFAASHTTAPLLMAEMASALPFYPMGFVKKPDGKFELVALLSLKAQENFFVTPAGKWRVPYVPSVYHGYPFKMLPAQSGDIMLCVDVEAGVFIDQPTGQEGKAAQRLFDESGQLTPAMQHRVAFLKKQEANRLGTQKAVQALADAQLIMPWPIQTKMPDGKTSPLKGLYTIDEAAIKNLSGDVLATLNERHALAIAFSQLLSVPRLKNLSQLYQLHEAEHSNRATEAVDLDRFFGEDDDLEFDFDL